MDIKEFARKYIYKGKELEEDYSFNLQWSLTLSLVILILLFLFVRGVKVQAYQSKANTEIQLEEVPEIQMLEEPPPPPKPKLPPQIEEAEEEEEAQEEEIEFETEFSEFEEPPPPPTPDTMIYEFFKVEVKPRVLKQAIPEYPEIARKAGIEGRVVIRAVVDENGNVIQAEVISSTNEIFNEPALKAAYKYKFSPAMMKDKPVKVRVIIPFVFKLQG